MDRNELKMEIIRLYAKSGSYILQEDTKESKNAFCTIFKHPTRNVLIEVWENMNGILTVLVYNNTTNATQRNVVECKTVKEFVNTVA